MQRQYSQIESRVQYLRTIVDTAWLYPTVNIEAVLTTTSVPHTYTGDQVVSTTFAELNQIANEIYANTVAEQQPGGYILEVGLLLKDLGKTLSFQLENGNIVATWRLVQLISNGTVTSAGKVGYIPVFYSEGNTPGQPFDPVRVVRVS